MSLGHPDKHPRRPAVLSTQSVVESNNDDRWKDCSADFAHFLRCTSNSHNKIPHRHRRDNRDGNHHCLLRTP